MEEEIDLRPYVEVIIRRWYWVIGLAVVAGLVAFGLSFVLPPSYEATALVAVTQPTEIVEFDSRIRSIYEDQPLTLYSDIAMSDELMLTLLSEVSKMDSTILSVEAIRALLDAKVGTDSRILRLTVTSGDSEITSEIANIWARLFVEKVNQLYGKDGDQLAFFQDQLIDAEANLDDAEVALIDFQERNRFMILENQLDALQQTQSNQLAKQQEIVSILQDVEGLQAQVETGSVINTQLITILLQARAFGGGQRDGLMASLIPVQIQVAATPTEEMSSVEQLALLENLQNVLMAQLTAVDKTLAQLEPQILEVQRNKQAAETESTRLLLNHALAEETYKALANKVEAEKITAQSMNRGVMLAGLAVEPSESVGSGRLLSMLVATVIGGLIATAIILFQEWWHSGK